jgi:signal transduction histidine kinase
MKPTGDEKKLAASLLTRAAAQLEHAPMAKVPARPAEELLHDLQVHQIELEMQNEALRQAKIALEESKSRYVDLYEFAPVGYLTLSAAGTIEDINLTGTILLRVPRKNLLHRQFISRVIAEKQDRWLRHFANATENGQDTVELALQRGDGTVFHAQLDSVKRKVGADGTAIRTTLTDISGRIETEVALRRSNADLEQFAYAAAHDLRQPLRAITSYLQLLAVELEPLLNAETRQNFHFATEGAQRMDQMLTALFDYSRVQRTHDGTMEIDSREVLDEALRTLQPAIEAADADVRVEGEWPHILAHRDEMLHLFIHLIDNALKFRLKDRKPEIVVSAAVQSRGDWRFTVRDNGVGLLPNQAPRLFKVFEHFRPRAQYPGTGIGLALCRKIVELHDGRIWAESPGEGQGSQFCVVIPQALSRTREIES